MTHYEGPETHPPVTLTKDPRRSQDPQEKVDSALTGHSWLFMRGLS